MRSFILLTVLVALTPLVKAQKLSVTAGVCEYQHNPLGIDMPKPRLSWKLKTGLTNTLQRTYELRVGADASALQRNQKILWTTGPVQSEQSVHVPYEGPELQSSTRYFWQVRVTDGHGNISPWSEVYWFETGLLKPDDWKAAWIESRAPEDSAGGPAILFRKVFSNIKAVKHARLYVSGHGIYEAFINGKRAGNAYLTPGWTSYNKRLQYQVYDVTNLLQQGQNAIGAMISDGWYQGYLAYEGKKNIYGKNLGLLMQLQIDYRDGSRSIIATDNTWRCASNGPVRASEIYNGEVYDARMERDGWSTASFNDNEWATVFVADFPKTTLVATNGPHVTKHEVFEPVKISTTPNGETVVDFGQNLVGWIQLSVSGPAGTAIVIDHAEVLDKHGNFYTDNLRISPSSVSGTFGSKVFPAS
jgi:alpha-L-rhamnosidase